MRLDLSIVTSKNMEIHLGCLNLSEQREDAPAKHEKARKAIRKKLSQALEILPRIRTTGYCC